MDKDTIEIYRKTNAVLNYDFIINPVKEVDVLNCLMDWSNKEENKGKKVYKHLIDWKYENVSKENFYSPYRINCKVPHCDYICYLTIYFQSELQQNEDITDLKYLVTNESTY